ncbi:helix-turn-helix domain-containing protein [Streptomyces canus]|uniref:AraC-like DNA-binding protein n=1 Tax=Streptomyces canus TaxID=58343 RepID=A0AAW8F511_9ACTN|nr:helix-turn-helix domain-containing protein [Streptomyces canus]MDQ0767055.1 AraC-like DNA-binding protein [Streptomyces canus]MDQ0904904.1 AraC-like DNA-binding protein [Streptomyces canus]MDQ1065092.1 AraC-like DNA-binding protein [Streptomyces canus]
MGAFRTTEGVPDHKKPFYWHEAVEGAFPTAEVSFPEGDCRDTLRTSRLGPARAVTLQGARMRVRWPASSVTSGGEQSLVLVTPVEGTVVVDQGDGAARTDPGGIALCDLARPTSIDFPAGHQVRCLIVPRWLLGLTEADLLRLTAAPIQPDTPPGLLLSPMLAQLVATAPTLSPGTGEALVRHVVDLISVLALERLQGEADDVPDTVRYLLPRILEHIDRRLDDPDLSLESIARAHAISVRYLHRIFECADTTVSRWVQRRRLQECRRDLARRQTAGLTISAVAHRWGFASAAHFSRTFRAMYGMSPAEWRRFALDGVRETVPDRPAEAREAVVGLLSRATGPCPSRGGAGAAAA